MVEDKKENQYVTKEELAIEFNKFEIRFEAKIDRKFDDFKQVMLDAFEHLNRKLDRAIERLDRHIGQNATEHSKFDSRICDLENNA